MRWHPGQSQTPALLHLLLLLPLCSPLPCPFLKKSEIYRAGCDTQSGVVRYSCSTLPLWCSAGSSPGDTWRSIRGRDRCFRVETLKLERQKITFLLTFPNCSTRIASYPIAPDAASSSDLFSPATAIYRSPVTSTYEGGSGFDRIRFKKSANTTYLLLFILNAATVVQS